MTSPSVFGHRPPHPRPNGKRGALLAASLCFAVLAGAGVFKDYLLESWHLHRLEHGDFEAQKAAALRLGSMRSARAVLLLVRVLASRPARPPIHSEHFGEVSTSSGQSGALLVGVEVYPGVASLFLEPGRPPIHSKQSEALLGGFEVGSGNDPVALFSLEPGIGGPSGDMDYFFDALPLYRESKELVLALSLVCEAKPGEVVPHLQQLLLDPDTYRSRVAAALLRYAGSHAASAVPALIQALRLRRKHVCCCDSDEYDGYRLIVAALGRLGPAARDAVPALQEILSDESRWRLHQDSAQALQQIQGTGAHSR